MADSEARTGLTAIVVGWMLAGIAAGTAIGATAHLVGAVRAVGAVVGSGGIVGALLGAAAWAWDRRRAGRRAAVLDGHGRWARPSAAALLGVPLAIGVASLLVLVVIGTVHTGSPLAGLAFLVVALGLLTLAPSVWVTGRLRAAALAAQAGREAEAARTWKTLARSRWAPRSAADQAALNLGSLALARQDGASARAWYGRVRGGRAAAFAASGLALLDVLDGRFAAAEHRLARTSRAGRAVQGEVDAVRLLLVWRRDGLAEALGLGDRLLGPESGVLFLAILAAIRREADDPEGAEALGGPALAEALRESTVARALPELRALLPDDPG